MKGLCFLQFTLCLYLILIVKVHQSDQKCDLNTLTVTAK